MAIFDPKTGLINCKITYYGPGMSGKTSSLQHIHDRMPADSRGDLLSIATETERTLFFDCSPPGFASIRGVPLRFHLYTTPGSVLYERTKIQTLNGADGIVFVADSQRDKLQENIKSLQEMGRALVGQGRSVTDTPIVLQYNKRDVPNALPVDVMDTYLNPPQMGWHRFATSTPWDRDLRQSRASPGVMDAFDLICQMIVERLAPTE